MKNFETINYDFSKLTETKEYGTEVTFTRYYTDEDGLYHACFTEAGKSRNAVMEADLYFLSVKGQTMKVAIDKDASPWVLLYPNATSHPKPVEPKAKAPAEVIAFRKKLLG